MGNCMKRSMKYTPLGVLCVSVGVVSVGCAADRTRIDAQGEDVTQAASAFTEASCATVAPDQVVSDVVSPQVGTTSYAARSSCTSAYIVDYQNVTIATQVSVVAPAATGAECPWIYAALYTGIGTSPVATAVSQGRSYDGATCTYDQQATLTVPTGNSRLVVSAVAQSSHAITNARPWNVGPGGYVTSGPWNGPAWSATSTTCPQPSCNGGTCYCPTTPTATSTNTAPPFSEGTPLCARGTITKMADYSAYAMVGISLNQSSLPGAPLEPYTPTGTGLSLNVTNNSPNLPGYAPLRAELKSADGATTWCANLNGPGGFVPWSAFNTHCWDNSGTTYNPSTSGTLVSVGVKQAEPVSDGYHYDFCVNSVSEQGIAGNTDPVIIQGTNYLTIDSGTDSWKGSAWTQKDATGRGTTLTQTFNGNQLCASGTVAPDPNWAGVAIVGMNLNQRPNSSTVNTTIPTGTGLYVNVSNNSTPKSDLRVEIEGPNCTKGTPPSEYDADDCWCAELPGSGGFIPWSSFNTHCWDNSGTAYNPSIPIVAAAVKVPGSNSVNVPYNFCVNDIGEEHAANFPQPTSGTPVAGLTTQPVEICSVAGGEHAACGVPGDPCSICSPGLTCQDGSCEAPCSGAQGTACCAADAHCAAGRSCQAGVCTCGVLGSSCCTTTSACSSSDLTCQAGSCVPIEVKAFTCAEFSTTDGKLNVKDVAFVVSNTGGWGLVGSVHNNDSFWPQDYTFKVALDATNSSGVHYAAIYSGGVGASADDKFAGHGHDGSLPWHWQAVLQSGVHCRIDASTDVFGGIARGFEYAGLGALALVTLAGGGAAVGCAATAKNVRTYSEPGMAGVEYDCY